MRQSDIFTVIIVATVGTIVAAILCNLLLGDPNDKSVTFKTISVVQPTLAQPDPEVFNPDAINPTVEVYVGDCEDVDQNGELSEAELIACGRSDAVVTVQNPNATATGTDSETGSDSGTGGQ